MDAGRAAGSSPCGPQRLPFWKTGVSVMRRRTTRPTIDEQARTAGTGCASPSATICVGREHGVEQRGSRRKRRRTRSERRGSGSCRTARACSSGAFSVATSAAPDHSPARPNALAGAAGAQKDDGRRAEHVIPGQQADDKCCDAHHHQGCDQGFLASELVAEVPEQQASRTDAPETTQRKVTKASSVAKHGVRTSRRR